MQPHVIIHLSKMTGTAGSEGHLLILAAGQRALGCAVQLWLLVEPDRPMQEYVDRAAAAGVPSRRFVIRRDFAPGLWRQLTAELRAARPDVVHTHLLHADLYGIPAARRAGVRWVVSSRHNDDRFRRLLPLRLLNRWLWRQTDAGIAISEAIRRFTIEVEGAAPAQIHTVHYGLDPSTVQAPPGARAALRAELGLPTDALLAGSVCRLIEQKGLVYALRGFAQIAGQVPGAHYVLAGDGPLRSALEDEARAWGLAGRAHFLGWRDDAHAVMGGLDVLVAPSLWEGFGLVLLEAMALSLPVIGTRVSAIPEVVVDGETGWLVPPADADALAGALRDALLDSEARRARGAAGRQRLETHFSAQAMVEHTLAVYRGPEGNG